jgi:hypothetical protein
VPSAFYLFRPFKNFLSGKRFNDKNALQKTAVQYFTSLGKEHNCEGIFKLVKQWDKCLNANGDCGKINISMQRFLTLLKIFSCNKYFDLIWCCTFKFGLPWH